MNNSQHRKQRQARFSRRAMAQQEIETVVVRMALFRDISAAARQLISRRATIGIFEAGDVLFEVGDMPDSLYVLDDGLVQLSTGVAHGRRRGQNWMVDLVRPGDAFGTTSVLTKNPYLVSATAVEKSRVPCVPGPLLRRLATTETQFAATMLLSLANQYRLLLRRVRDLSLRTVVQRFGIYLLRLHGATRNENAVFLPFEKKTIAAHLHMTPESMSRSITALCAQGVDIDNDEVRIKDIDRLRRFCQVDNLLDVGDLEFDVADKSVAVGQSQ